MERMETCVGVAGAAGCYSASSAMPNASENVDRSQTVCRVSCLCSYGPIETLPMFHDEFAATAGSRPYRSHRGCVCRHPTSSSLLSG
jgi:hypothetical protein